MSGINVAVVGAAGLAAALEESGRFEAVHRFQTTSQLRGGIGALSSLPPQRLVFLFADNTPNDLPEGSVADLVGRLSQRAYRVAVIECSSEGRNIVTQHPGAGLIPAPVTLNIVLGALSDRGLGLIEPVTEPWAYATIDPTNPAAVQEAKTASGPAGAPLADVFGESGSGSWQQTSSPSSPGNSPSTEPWGVQPAAAPSSGWGEMPTSAQPSGAQWGGSIESAVPVSSPWGEAPRGGFAPEPAGFSATESTTPSWPQQPAQESGWAEQTSAPVAQPWGQQPAQDGGWGQQPTAPVEQTWGQQPAQDGGWGQQPTAPVEQTWGQQPAQESGWSQQPAQESPWGQTAQTPSWGQQPAAAPQWQQGAMQPAPWEQQTQAAPMPGTYDLPTSKRRGFVISVCVAKGGAGKSSLTLNLGVWLGLRLRATGHNVCIVDANWQQADIGKQINAYNPNIYGLSQHPEDLHPARIAQHLYTRQDLGNTSFLLGPARVEEANPLWINAQLYANAIETLRHLFDYVIVDTPVAEFHHELFTDFVIPHSDFLVVPVIPNWPTIINTDAWLRAITLPTSQGGQGFDERRVGIVLNRAEADVGFDENDVQSELGSWEYLGAIPNSREWVRAGIEGDIVATRNYAEINHAFAGILYRVTGEQVLLEGLNTGEPTRVKRRGIKGLFGR